MGRQLFLGFVTGGVVGAGIVFLIFVTPSIREAIYSRLGYYMTYVPAVIPAAGALTGLLLVLRSEKAKKK